MSGTPIANTKGAKSPINSKPSMTTSRMGKSKSVTPSDRWGHSTHNPTGASNKDVEKS